MRYDLINKARKGIEDVYGPLPIPKKSYIILMSPRCGSNLLCAHFKKINSGNPIEAFHKPKNLVRLYDWNIDFSNPFERIKKAIEFQTTEDILGMKINWNQFRFLMELIIQLIDQEETEFTNRELLEIIFPKLQFIRLDRKDKIKQAVSLSKGVQTGIWVISAESDSPELDYVVPPIYDRDLIDVSLKKLLSYHFEWDQFLQESEINFHEVWYEDIASDFTSTILDIHRFLDIDSEIPKPQTRKLAGKQSDDWAERFIAETPWVKNEDFQDKLSKNDFSGAFIKSLLLQLEEEEANIHAKGKHNRFKKIRYYFMRLKKNLGVE